MPAPKLTSEQREQLLEWIAADYDGALIRRWFAERAWPELTRPALAYYRKRYGTQISELRAARYAAALNTGLACKEERIQRLKEHADRLEAIKWQAHSKTGRLWNEKAWRETLNDIALELGHRRQGIDLTLERELENFLDNLRDNLDESTYARILALAARSATDRI